MNNAPNPNLLPELPIERAETIPSAWYTERAFWERDVQHVISPSWQFVGHEAELPHPGDYLRAEIAGQPLVLVRDRSGELRAFYNVCKHRGGPLVTQDRGNLRMLQCQYHGWTYQLDGALRGVPKMDRCELFDRSAFALSPIALAQWQGLVFVAIDPPQNTLDVHLGGIADRIAPQSPSRLRPHSRIWYDVACNWKVYVDNYLEGYHLPLVHPELCTVLDVKGYETETFPTYSLQYSPLRDGDGLYGEGQAFYYFVFPNLMLNILPGRMQVNRVDPIAPDSCRVLFAYYYEDVTSPEAQKKIAEDQAFSDRVQQEDIDICEHVQKGLASRAYDRGRFSPDEEQGVHHFQTLLTRAYAKR